MKKLILLMFMLVFLVGTVSALTITTWDNWKYYDEETKTITIKNNFILKTLEKATLLSNTYNCATECKATKEITLYEDGVLINDLRFYRLFTDGSKEISEPRRYSLKYYIDVGEEVWIDKETLKNGTIIRESKIIYNQNNFRWVNYELGTEVNAGTYQVKLEGTKKVNKIYDWQIQLQGRWINEWATWGNISLGDDAEVLLISPENNTSFAINDPVSYNATANITGGATLVNMSLYDDSSGTWLLNETIIVSGTITLDAHGKDINAGQSTTLKTGMKVNTNTAFSLKIITKEGGGTATKGYIAYGGNKSIIATTDFIGNNATFSPSIPLSTATDYWLFVDSDGSSYQSRFSGEISGYPVTGTNVDWIKGQTLTGETTLRWSSVESVTTEVGVVTFSAQNFSKVVLNKTIWNVQACDSDGDCGFAVNNRTIILDIIPPTLNVTEPFGTINFQDISINQTLKFNVSDLNLDTCTLQYESSNTTVDCSTNITNFTIGTDRTLTFFVNDTAGNAAGQVVNWNYLVLQTSTTFNSSDHETANQRFTVNITTNGSVITSGTLTFDGTENTGATITNPSGDNYSITKSIVIPTSIGTKTHNFNLTIISKIINTTAQTMVINATNFTLCGSAPLNIPFINITFRNETLAQEEVKATIVSTWTYSLSDLSGVNKTLTFTNATENLNYTFCANPSDRTLNIDLSMSYNNDISQQRNFLLTTVLSNTLLTQVLFLLPTTDGLFSPFKTVTINGDTITNVKAIISRIIGGSTTIISSGFTDGSGFITFFLDPDETYSATFSKIPFADNAFSFSPTADLRTVVMGTGAAAIANGTIITRGTTYTISPINSTLPNNTVVSFTFNVTSNLTSITLISMNITNSSNSELLFVSNAGVGNLSGTLNTGNNTRLFGSYIIETGEETISVTRMWLIFTTFTGDYSILKQFTLAKDNELISEFVRFLIIIAMMFGILIFMNKEKIIETSESNIAVLLLLTWAFSLVGWLDTGLAVSTTDLGINRLGKFSNQFGIAMVLTLPGLFFIFRRLFIRVAR